MIFPVPRILEPRLGHSAGVISRRFTVFGSRRLAIALYLDYSNNDDNNFFSKIKIFAIKKAAVLRGDKRSYPRYVSC